MFEFLFKKKTGEEPIDVIELIKASLTKIELSKLALEKAVNLISNSVAGSKIKIYDATGKEIKNELFYKLNIRPNNFMVGFEFWKAVITKLLNDNECLIISLSGNFYIASDFSVTNSILSPKKYSNINIYDGNGNSIILQKTYQSDDVIHLKFDNKKVKAYLNSVLKEYNKIVSAVSAGNQSKAVPKYLLSTSAQVPVLKTKLEDGNERNLTLDELTKNINKLLEDDSLKILRLPDTLKLSEIKSGVESSVSDMTQTAKEIFTTCAIAFDIPEGLFLGNIQKDSKTINEYITFAVKPIAKLLQESLCDALIGMEDYLNGERIVVDISNFKHIDIIDAASNLDKLRSNGWTLDEIRELCGLPPIGDKFSTTRVLTKNYGSEGGEG